MFRNEEKLPIVKCIWGFKDVPFFCDETVRNAARRGMHLPPPTQRYIYIYAKEKIAF